MIIKLIDKFRNLDEKVLHIMKNGFRFSFVVCIISALILFSYITLIKLPILFYVGTSVFKISLMFFADFIICGLAFDTIKKQMA